MAESNLGALAASLQCPVCFEIFPGRIFQCSQGHSVCERCHSQLTNAKCPNCRSDFIGTRNYILEDFVKQLQLLKKSPQLNSAALEITTEIAKIVDEIASAAGSTENLTLPAVQQPNNSTENAEQVATFPDRLPQPGGLFHCRLDCDAKLPICRLLNHFKSMHPEKLFEDEATTEFATHFNFQSQNFRRALSIRRFGLFFFIVNVVKQNNKTVFTAWLQIVGRRDQCRFYKYELSLKVGSVVASYTDASYGDWTPLEVIQENKRCLYLESTENVQEVEATLLVNRLVGSISTPRSTTTTIVRSNEVDTIVF